jgi:23S rRNA (guanine745-N1)-methyltransferase
VHPDLVAALRCPHCGAGLGLTARTASCPLGHAFDLAKQGYLNLLADGATGIEGDSAAMVEARLDFLREGHYSPIREALVEAAPAGDGLVVEVGAGTAYYLAGVVEAGPGRTGLALDVSRYAARRAAKVSARIGSVVCDAWRELPVRDGAAQVLLNVFAPRNAAEMARVLAPGGTLLVVTPNQGHLAELVDVLGLVRVDGDKDRRLADTLVGRFHHTGSRSVETVLRLERTAVRQLVAMGPSARHTDPEALDDRLAVLAEPVEVTLSVTVSGWQRS